MNKFFLLTILFLFTGIGISFGQSSRETAGELDRGATYGYQKSKKLKKKKGARKLDKMYDFDAKVKEHERLMEANAKKKVKIAKKMEKPQYSDPSYFGHKKKPKKRKPGKKKFCKECGMTH